MSYMDKWKEGLDGPLGPRPGLKARTDTAQGEIQVKLIEMFPERYAPENYAVQYFYGFGKEQVLDDLEALANTLEESC